MAKSAVLCVPPGAGPAISLPGPPQVGAVPRPSEQDPEPHRAFRLCS